MTPQGQNGLGAAGEPPAADTPSEFWSDAGPAFNPESSPDAPEPEQLLDETEDVGWTPDGVRDFLAGVQAPAFNALLNPLLGVEDVDWAHREARLQQVAPAIAREWNRIPEVRALAGHTDRGLILSYLLLEYLGPRAFQVVKERKERAEATDGALGEADTPAAAAAAAPEPETVTRDPGPRITGLPKRGV